METEYRRRVSPRSLQLGTFLGVSLAPAWAVAAESSPTPAGSGDERFAVICWLIAFVGALAALIQAKFFYESMRRQDQGNERMRQIAGYVQRGANAYLDQQFKVVAAFFFVIAILLGFAAFGLKVQSEFVPFAFLTGGFFSGLAGWFGMTTATAASNRTAAAAQNSLNEGLQVAFRSGAVMGLTVVGLGLMDIAIWFAFLYWVWPMMGFEALNLTTITATMLCFGMGASAQALFARVGGGIFTKAADVGADLVGKVEQNIPEDDPRNPATIADNVGDNVGDVAGMGADLYESYAGSVLATAALGAAAFTANALLPEGIAAESAQLRAMFLPMVIAGLGIFASIFGIYMVRTGEEASQKSLLNALSRGINLSTALVIVGAIIAAKLIMPLTPGTDIGFAGIPGVGVSIVVGLITGVLIGWWTEYVTSDEYQPTQRLSEQAVTGPATVIIGGIADGMASVWVPVILICVATLGSYGFATGWEFRDMAFFSLGLYGVGIAAVGMLSTLGITLATDAYGPIADNAGGNAEMSGLPAIVRERTDALDSLGNTTAATGKGFAIGSAALTALALLAAYVEGVRVGFDRWGDAFAEQMIDNGQLDEGLYKVAPRFAVQVVNATDNEGEQVAAAMKAKDSFLIMPQDLQFGEQGTAWSNVEVGERLPVGSPDSMLVLNEAGAPQWQSSGTPLLSMRDVTLPEFGTYFEANLLNPKVLVGVFCGAMATFVFCAMTMTAVGRAAQGMVQEVRRQFKETVGIMDGSVQPDYERPVEISTRAAQREMLLPSFLGLCLPVVVGLLMGVTGVLGLLMGTLTTGFCLAIFMANAGGAWDNAKKYIEAGAQGGKGTDAHKAAVVGDTVGDPFKDTSGPSLNILIKLMSMTSVVVAGLVVRYSLSAMGIF